MKVNTFKAVKRAGWLGCLAWWGMVVASAESSFYLDLQPSGLRLGPFEYREGAEVVLGSTRLKVVPIADPEERPVNPRPGLPDYDGIRLGDHRDEVIRKLLWVPGVRRNENGVPFFNRVKGEPFYAYQVFRSPDESTNLSQVFVFFEEDRVVMIQDTFDGEWIWTWEDAKREFDRKLRQFVPKWGEPTNVDETSVEWLRPKAVAVLRLDKPGVGRKAPELKFGIRKK